MKNKFKRIVKAFTVLIGSMTLPYLLTACTTVSLEDCQMFDWQQMASAAAAANGGIETLTAKRKRCRELGAQVDSEAIKRGHKLGLMQYCTPIKAYRVAQHAAVYRLENCAILQGDISTQQIDKALMLGREYQALHDVLLNLRSESESLAEQHQELDVEIQQLRDYEPEGEYAAELSRVNRASIREKQHEQAELGDRINKLNANIAKTEDLLDSMEQRHLRDMTY